MFPNLTSVGSRFETVARTKLQPFLPTSSANLTNKPAAPAHNELPAQPAAKQHGSTQAILSRRSGARAQPSQPHPEDTVQPQQELAEGVTVVQPGNPTAILMAIQEIQFLGSMIQNAEQGLASMTTSASRGAVDAVQDLAA
jgi:hypothetical protein